MRRMGTALVFSDDRSKSREISIASTVARTLVPDSRNFVRFSTRNKCMHVGLAAENPRMFAALFRDRTTQFLPTLQEVLAQLEREQFGGRLVMMIACDATVRADIRA